MVFSSTIFLFAFLPLVIILYQFVGKRFQNLFLLLVSSLFYYYGEQEKLLLMYFVIVINYLTARLVYSGLEEDGSYKEKKIQQKCYLLACVVICIGLLWFYKYFNFTLDLLALAFSGAANYKLAGIVLPLGISFYTFHVLSYTLDVYFGRMKVEKNLLNFAAYVLMFPQLVAGPIVRYRDICQQFYYRVVTGVGFVNGVRRFCYGLAKKVLIANTVSVYVDKVFAIPVEQLTTADCWLGAIAYSLQIYFDFSGYSDMAIGLAMLFGFHYKENFNYPYVAKSAAEFWRRWHISLSTWLRDYVYIHMGGNRNGSLVTYRNILFVFLCSGLWHGANMTFVCWGLWYGVFIVLENMGLKKLLKQSSIVAHFYLLLIAVSGWIIFRADTVNYAGAYLLKMYSFQGFSLTQEIERNIVAGLVMGCVLSYDWRPLYKALVMKMATNTKGYHSVFKTFKLTGYALALVLFLLSVSSIVCSEHNPFIYFRF